MSEAGATTFSFGRNWEDFIQSSFDQGRLDTAQKHLLGFLRLSDLAGRTFLDVGSGSGIHSLAALRAGARSIVSFDLDPCSVSTTADLRRRAGEPANWNVRSGS